MARGCDEASGGIHLELGDGAPASGSPLTPALSRKGRGGKSTGIFITEWFDKPRLLIYNRMVLIEGGAAMVTLALTRWAFPDGAADLDATFGALADPTRRAILARLAQGEATVTELAEPFAMTQPAISKHLKVLEKAGLISRSRDAQRRPCRLEARALARANAYLERYRRYWEREFQQLDSLLAELQSAGDSQTADTQ
jgi:DNA-binding transcriptional ArsR family regulator